MDSLEAFSKLSLRLMQRLAGAQIAPLMDATLDDLCRYISFDAGWWGWTRKDREEASLLSSSPVALPQNYAREWQRRASVRNPISLQMARRPDQPALYDRLEDNPSSPIAAFKRSYNIRHVMYGAGLGAPNNPHLFLSLYRKGDTAPGWTESEIRLFSKVVPLLGSSIQHCDLRCNENRAYDEMHLDIEPCGTVLTRFPCSASTLRGFFPDWSDPGVVPKPYRSLFTKPGRHQLIALGVVIEVRPKQLRDCGIDILAVNIRRRRPCDVLTPKEMEVAALLISGRSARVVADMLGKSQYTVRNQVQSIYSKLAVSSRVELTKLFGPDPTAVNRDHWE